MEQYAYIFKNDYNKSFKIKDNEYYCYSKTKLKYMYFDKNDFRIIGETLKVNKNADGITGTLDMKDGVYLDVFPRGTHRRRFYTREGYLCVGRHTYIVLLKKRFL